ncbi:hypothetical protein BCU84_16485 [Shewanella sp. 10N.286.51.B7]|uniref:hypothetical protein n=1 Tax=Shewanella sp. 10N.286.51.B7 TaxID=1880836 RepID=UPI000C833803|nr:hypothetical protein [Shewanella sp. 10N.286.51.B7]PMG75223.1 hypothetical protein BCU84_16485 [Shewanella sp. 10N.286.51.B7]
MKKNQPQQENLDDLIASLPKEISPKADLWQDIDDQISAKTNSNRTQNSMVKGDSHWKMIAMAASLAFVMVLGWKLSTPNISSTETLTVNNALSNQSTEDLIALVDQIAQTHQQQISSFEDNKYTVGMQLDNQTNPFNKGFSELELASKEIQQALKNDPNNKQVWDLWLWIMKREIELLQQQQRTPMNTAPSTQGNQI